MANDNNLDERRLWIGNLDTRMTEYQLLKILQKCGNIEKFDMLFHKSGPQAGQPRGFAFCTYKTIEESLTALEKLNGKLIGNKHIVVRLAKNINYDELERPKPKVEIPILAAGSSKDKKISKQIAIQAIEAKLKMLESQKDDDDFEINRTHTNEIPLIQRYQFNKDGNAGGSGNSGGISSNNRSNKSHTSSRYHHSKSRPYNKKYRR